MPLDGLLVYFKITGFSTCCKLTLPLFFRSKVVVAAVAGLAAAALAGDQINIATNESKGSTIGLGALRIRHAQVAEVRPKWTHNGMVQ